MNNQSGTVKNTRLIGIMALATAILLLPLIAMQFTTEVDWDVTDFVIMGFLLYGTGLVCEFVLRKVKKNTYRLALVTAVLFLLFLTWAELAVGIFGTPFAGN